MSRPKFALRPLLECLEDRAVPAVFNVTTFQDNVTPGDGKRTLREAVNAANATPGTDAIVLPAGIYRIALNGAGEDANAIGDFDITDSVTITGAGRGLTLIDGQQLDRVFQVIGSAPGSIKVVLERMKVRNGKGDAPGGGIAVTNANLVVRDAAVTGNQATGATGNGGGIFADSAAPIKLVRSAVADNTAGNFGGGIDATSATLLDSVVRRNTAIGNGGGIGATVATLVRSTVSGNAADLDGGGIFAINTATLTNCTVSGNGADFGGGIRASDTATLTNCTVSGNSAGDGGGGISASTANLTNCTVSENLATDFGGGVQATTANLTKCTVSGNSVPLFGGGGISASTANLTNSTVSGNSAGFGAGIVAFGTVNLTNCTVVKNSGGGLYRGGSGGAFTLRNTIVALNSATSGPDVSGPITSLGHNLIGDGTGGTGFSNSDIVGTSENPIDPLLGPLANNGGRTKTHKLLAGSPAIDHGDNAAAPATDQRGLPRKKDGNGDGIAVVDIGAFER